MTDAFAGRASMKGFPRRGSNLRLDRLEQADALLASMKGFPRRGSNHPKPFCLCHNISLNEGLPQKGKQ